MMLRAPTPDEAATVAALARATFTETFGHLYDPADLAAFVAGHTDAAYAAEIADSAFAIRLAEVDGALAGFVKLGPPSLPFTPPAGAIEIRQFYVLAPFHGSGLAPAMMDWALGEARARGCAHVFLSVFIDNHRARRFYARYGFHEVGPYIFKVGNHEDEDIVLRLDL